MGLSDNENKKRAGKAGGKTGGANRAKALSPAQREAIAKKGGEAKKAHQNLPDKKPKM